MVRDVLSREGLYSSVHRISFRLVALEAHHRELCLDCARADGSHTNLHSMVNAECPYSPYSGKTQ